MKERGKSLGLTSRNRRLRVDCLEDRRMLAFNAVQVSFAGDDLSLIGDGGDNEIEITQSGSLVTVTGLNDTFLFINGLPAGQVAIGAVEDLIKVDLDGGDDSLTIDGIESVPGPGVDGPDRIKVEMKAGADTTDLTDLDISGYVLVEPGSGDDSTSITDSEIDGKVIITDPSGTNDVTIDPTTIGGPLKITGGTGDDSVLLDDVHVLSGTMIDNTAGGDNDTTIDASEFEKNVTINGGAGKDDTVITSSYFDGDKLKVDGGEGDNVTDLDKVDNEGTTIFRGGDGDDDVIVTDSVLDGNVLSDLGNGINSFSTNPTTYGGNLKLIGGNNPDTFTITDATILGKLFVRLGSGLGNVLDIVDSSVKKSTNIGGFNRRDFVTIDGSTFDGTVDIDLKQKDDELIIVDSVFNKLFEAHGGIDDDLLDIQDSDFNAGGAAFGDAGVDTIVNAGNTGLLFVLP